MLYPTELGPCKEPIIIHSSGSSNPVLCDKRGGVGWEVEGWFKRVETYVYLWLIHVDVW